MSKRPLHVDDTFKEAGRGNMGRLNKAVQGGPGPEEKHLQSAIMLQKRPRKHMKRPKYPTNHQRVPKQPQVCHNKPIKCNP